MTKQEVIVQLQNARLLHMDAGLKGMNKYVPLINSLLDQYNKLKK